jgi:hypothetical protein
MQTNISSRPWLSVNWWFILSVYRVVGLLYIDTENLCHELWLTTIQSFMLLWLTTRQSFMFVWYTTIQSFMFVWYTTIQSVLL